MLHKSICSVSIDLDSISCYTEIHGLDSHIVHLPDISKAPDLIYSHALPRFLELLQKHHIRATLFVVGRDVQHPQHAQILQEAADRGHELANHTYNHPYRLIAMSADDIVSEISMGAAAISDLLPNNQSIAGFRCPGYNTSSKILAILRQQGYLYDSSIFPCPPYYLAKAMILGWMSLQKRQSRSIIGSPRVLFSPTHPYKPGIDPHHPSEDQAFTNQQELWELPISVIPGIRLPFIGTSIALYPRYLLPSMTWAITRHNPFLNLEFHGIDLLDIEDHISLNALASYQPDLHIPLVEKHKRFDQLFAQLSQSYQFIPMIESIAYL